VSATSIITISSEAVVSINTSTTYKLRAQLTNNVGTGSGTVYGSSSANGNSVFYATRIG
jgi:hypothetical protein